VLDQHGDEALHAAVQRAVNHDRLMALVVLADVLQLEARRQVVVHLHGADLPFALEGVAHDEVQLGAIEGRLALFHCEVQPPLGRRSDDRLGRLLPHRVAAHIFVALRVADAHARPVVGQSQAAEDELHQVYHPQELVLKLLRRAEDMRVVLGETAHAGQAVQLARLLVAVDRAELGQAHRQVAVRMQVVLVDVDVVRAVHRLEHEQVALHLEGRVLAVLVVRVVPALLVKRHAGDVRRDDRLVAALDLHLAQEALQQVAQDRAVGLPQRQALAHQLVEGEQAELLAEHAMIALLGLFKQGQVVLKLLGRLPGCAVDAGEHLAVLVAAPVGPRRSLEGDAQRIGVDLARVGDVRPPAQVFERVLGVGADDHRFVGFLAVLVHAAALQPVNQFELIRLVVE